MHIKTPLKYAAVLSLLGATAIYADIAEDTYKSLIGKSVFTSNNQFLQTGWYKFDKDNGETPDLTNANFVGSYYFGAHGDTWRPFLQGGFGFSQIEQDAVNLGTTVGDIDLDSTYWKLGAGMNFNPNSDLAFVLGASAMWMNTDSGNFSAYTPPVSQKLTTLFDTESDTTLYDVYGSVVFHPAIMGYNTHFEATLHYIDIDYDHGIDSLDGYNADLKAGFHTHTLTTLMALPVWAEFYVGAVLLDDDLSEIIGFDSAFSLGSSLHWKVGPMIHIFNDAFKDVDLSANLQGTTSNSDYEGWKASLSFNIVKF